MKIRFAIPALAAAAALALTGCVNDDSAVKDGGGDNASSVVT